MNYILKISGKVVPKGRPRFSEGKVFTPIETKNYEQHVVECWIKSKLEKLPDDIPLAICVVAYSKTPKSREIEALSFDGKFCKTKPDADNLMKSIMDGLNEFAYSDDSRIVAAQCIKKYGTEDCAYVFIGTMVDENDKMEYIRYINNALMYNKNKEVINYAEEEDNSEND